MDTHLCSLTIFLQFEDLEQQKKGGIVTTA